MESNNYIDFKVMVTFPHLLKERIEKHNKLYKTDFELKEIIEDEVGFCIIRANKDKLADIFNLGYGLAVDQYSLKEKGEIDW